VVLFVGGTLVHNPKLFFSADEDRAFRWLQTEAPPDGVVLSSTELAAFIPAYTSQRAVSGNDFLTVNAKVTEQQVNRFYSLKIHSDERRALLAEWRADYVLLGPRERRLGVDTLSKADGVILAVEVGEVVVYQVHLP